MKIKIPRDQVTISVEALEEDIHWTDKSLGYDLELQQSFRNMVADYGLWGWCCVRVTASWQGFKGTGYLGCCSYTSEAAFIECGDYYPQKVEEAVEELEAEVVTALHMLEKLKVAVAPYVIEEALSAPPA